MQPQTPKLIRSKIEHVDFARFQADTKFGDRLRWLVTTAFSEITFSSLLIAGRHFATSSFAAIRASLHPLGRRTNVSPA